MEQIAHLNREAANAAPVMQGRANALDRAQREIVANMPKEPQLADAGMEQRARQSYSDPKSPFYQGSPEGK